VFMKKIYFALYIGFYAGLIWGIIRWLFYFFEFTKVLPAFLIEPFFRKEFMHSWTGHLAGIGAFIGMSLVASLLYSITLHKLKGPWPGIMYGMIWWIIIFVIIGPFTGMVHKVWSLDLNSILSEACVFTLWGVFIGYSIALEFTDERSSEPQLG